MLFAQSTRLHRRRLLQQRFGHADAGVVDEASRAACAMASMIRLAFANSAAEGVNTSLQSAICEGWIAHFPS